MATKKSNVTITSIFFSVCILIWLFGSAWIAVTLAIIGVCFKALIIYANNAPKSFDLGNMHEWKLDQLFEAEVVGESNYQSELATLAKQGMQHYAVLFPEDDNEFDSKAVAIFIDGLKVGYLPKDAARSFRRRLKKENLENKPTKVKALILGGHQLKDGRNAEYGVTLNIQPF